LSVGNWERRQQEAFSAASESVKWLLQCTWRKVEVAAVQLF